VRFSDTSRGFAGMASSAMPVLVVLSLHGCASKCTTRGCVPHVDIYFKSPLKDPGQYRVELDAGPGETATCTATVPYSRDAQCSADTVSWIIDDPGTSASNSPSPGTTANVVGLTFSGQAAVVGIRVLRDDAVIGEASIQPTYRGEEINGAGCGECPVAIEHVAVP
jgi:hypothetical protein